MRFFIAAVFFAALSRALFAADAATLITSALEAEARFDTKAALALFREADRQRPDDSFILQKISRQLSDSTNDTMDRAEQKKLAAEALAYAERAARLSPTNPVNVLSRAVCHGKIATFTDSTREKIASSRLVRADAERALALDPNYDWAHHLLGRWHYEVAGLGRTQRWVVKLIYGGLPDASYEDALKHLRIATQLAPDNVSHQLELGHAMLAAGDKVAARAAFEKGLAMPDREKHDDAAKRRARQTIEKLQAALGS
jgi:tetratricopeptide (TPR) repeat protein